MSNGQRVAVKASATVSRKMLLVAAQAAGHYTAGDWVDPAEANFALLRIDETDAVSLCVAKPGNAYLAWRLDAADIRGSEAMAVIAPVDLANALGKMAKAAEVTLEIDDDAGAVYVEHAGKHLAVPTQGDPLHVPHAPATRPIIALYVGAADLFSALERVAFAANPNSKRPLLRAVNVALAEEDARHVTVMATDSARLAYADLWAAHVKAQGEIKKWQQGCWLLPVEEVRRLLKVFHPEGTIRLELHYHAVAGETLYATVFHMGNATLLIENINNARPFPAWRPIVQEAQEGHIVVEIPYGILRKVLRIATNTCKLHRVTMTVTPGPAHFEAESPEMQVNMAIHPVVNGLGRGEEFTVTFNARYLLEFLQALKGRAKANSPVRLICRSSEDAFHASVQGAGPCGYVLMPILPE